MSIVHVPVMLEEVIEAMKVKKSGVYVDGTVGLGGHAEGILRSIAGGCTLVGIDRDSEALEIAKKRLKNRNLMAKKYQAQDLFDVKSFNKFYAQQTKNLNTLHKAVGKGTGGQQLKATKNAIDGVTKSTKKLTLAQKERIQQQYQRMHDDFKISNLKGRRLLNLLNNNLSNIELSYIKEGP